MSKVMVNPGVAITFLLQLIVIFTAILKDKRPAKG